MKAIPVIQPKGQAKKEPETAKSKWLIKICTLYVIDKISDHAARSIIIKCTLVLLFTAVTGIVTCAGIYELSGYPVTISSRTPAIHGRIGIGTTALVRA